GSFRWSIILTPSSVHSIVFTITGYSSIMKGCVISAPMTGSGKTTVTLGLLSALRKRGLTVQPFKVGPDFIVPDLPEVPPAAPSIEIPERHLGLFTAKEEVTALRVRAIGDFFDAHIDIANILDAVGAVYDRPGRSQSAPTVKTQRVALAHDKAFSFYYHANRL